MSDYRRILALDWATADPRRTSTCAPSAAAHDSLFGELIFDNVARFAGVFAPSGDTGRKPLTNWVSDSERLGPRPSSSAPSPHAL